MITLRAADGASADVYLHGAHVTSWRPAPDGDDRLFLSTRSAFRAGSAIRGGIPVIFPQFAAEGPLPRHGFARTSEWSLVAIEEHQDGAASATFALAASPATRAIWPVDFRATVTVHVGGARLSVALGVENTGSSPFSFTCALHSYLRVRNVAEISVLGLQGTRYRESSAPTVFHVDDESAVRVADGRAIDRVYVNAPSVVTLRERDRDLRVDKKQFVDTVLWNPGRDAAAALADMPPHGERRMFCIEAAVVQQPIVLAGGAQWSGVQTLDASDA